MSRLTYAKKRNWKPIIVAQTGYYCFFCKRSDIPLEYGHLNSNRDDSRPENLAFMCHVCNNRMKDDFDMDNLANDQLTKNESAELVRERKHVSVGTTEDLTSCQTINKINFAIAEHYLIEHADEELVLPDTIRKITAICRKNNDTGSQQAVRRYIEILITPPYPFGLTVNSRGQTIIRRTEN